MGARAKAEAKDRRLREEAQRMSDSIREQDELNRNKQQRKPDVLKKFFEDADKRAFKTRDELKMKYNSGLPITCQSTASSMRLGRMHQDADGYWCVEQNVYDPLKGVSERRRLTALPEASETDLSMLLL